MKKTMNTHKRVDIEEPLNWKINKKPNIKKLMDDLLKEVERRKLGYTHYEDLKKIFKKIKKQLN